MSHDENKDHRANLCLLWNIIFISTCHMLYWERPTWVF